MQEVLDAKESIEILIFVVQLEEYLQRGRKQEEHSLVFEIVLHSCNEWSYSSFLHSLRNPDAQSSTAASIPFFNSQTDHIHSFPNLPTALPPACLYASIRSLPTLISNHLQAMPAYLCHLCTTYNPFPSPLCQNCNHKYCIICLPIIPDPYPIQPSSLDSSTGYDSSISSFTLDEPADQEPKDEDIIREFLSIHPAHRLTRPPSPIELTGSEPEALSASPEQLPADVVITTATPTEPSTRYHPGTNPLSTPPPLARKSSSPLLLSSYSLFPRTPVQATTTTTTTRMITKSPIPFPHTTRPSIARTITDTSPLAPPPQKPHHKRHGSIPELIATEGDLLRRTMSVQGEKVSRLVRKGSMRLKEVCVRGGGGGGGGRGKGGLCIGGG